MDRMNRIPAAILSILFILSKKNPANPDPPSETKIKHKPICTRNNNNTNPTHHA
jgi:hypothetical protein